MDDFPLSVRSLLFGLKQNGLFLFWHISAMDQAFSLKSSRKEVSLRRLGTVTVIERSKEMTEVVFKPTLCK